MKPTQFLGSICIVAALVLMLGLFLVAKPATAQGSTPFAGLHAGQTLLLGADRIGLLFVSRDDALAFYEPSSGQIQKLTEPFTGKEFSVSPDGRTILFGNQILSLQSQTGGDVYISVSMAANHGEPFKLNWSPDGKEYGYVEQDGSTWIEDLPGNRQQLYKSDSPPEWSFDGRWIAYCDQRGRLWIAETGKPADWIARQGRCTITWSPKKPVLAYVMYPAGSDKKPAVGIAYLYNPITGRTLEIARSVSGLVWSPNGKLVSISRSLSSAAGNPSYSITIVNPETGQEQFLEQYSPTTGPVPNWIEQKNGYLFGRYRLQSDLLTKEMIADHLIDATQDGDKLLIGSEKSTSLDVLCQDVEKDQTFPLLQIPWTDSTRSSLSGKFSPDGSWIWIRHFVGGKTVYRLARCDSSTPLFLPGGNQGTDPYFSTDSNWLVIERTYAVRQEFANIFILDLKSGRIQEISAGLDTHSVWFQMPGLPGTSEALMSSMSLSSRSGGTMTATENDQFELQTGFPKRGKSLVLLPFLLWAGALVAIVIVVLYRWKYPWK